MKSIVLEEAYRSIAIRDGDRLVQMPVAQAIMRSIALNAAKGDQRSQQRFVTLLEQVERTKKSEQDELLKTYIEYKTSCEAELQRREWAGEIGLTPYPHPDDIEIKMGTGQVELRDPITREEEKHWEKLQEIGLERGVPVPSLREFYANCPRIMGGDNAPLERRLRVLMEVLGISV